MNTLVSIGIACVPDRYRDVKRMLDSVPAEHRKFVFPFYDNHHVSSWFGHRGAMRNFHKDATHHLVIEDDVALCHDFITHLYACIHAQPDKLISVYASRASKQKVAWAHRNNVSWFVDKYGASGQGVMWPVEMLKELLYWEVKYCPADMPYEDSRLWGWAYENDIPTWNTVPSLVEHMQPMRSMLGFNNKGKVAADFLGNACREVDFSLIPTNPHVFKYITGMETYSKWTNRYKGERYAEDTNH